MAEKKKVKKKARKKTDTSFGKTLAEVSDRYATDLAVSFEAGFAAAEAHHETKKKDRADSAEVLRQFLLWEDNPVSHISGDLLFRPRS